MGTMGWKWFDEVSMALVVMPRKDEVFDICS